MAGNPTDNMQRDLLPPDVSIRQIIMYLNNNNMCVGLIFEDEDGNQIYKSRYVSGFTPERRKLTVHLAPNEVICGIRATTQTPNRPFYLNLQFYTCKVQSSNL